MDPGTCSSVLEEYSGIEAITRSFRTLAKIIFRDELNFSATGDMTTGSCPSDQ